MVYLKTTVHWLLVLIWAGVIFRLSSIPGKDLPQLFPFQDKAFHVIIYFILAGLIIAALKSGKGKPSDKNLCVITLLSVLFYGISDEAHQMFVPLRSCSVWDLCWDVIGGGLAVVWALKTGKPDENKTV